MVFETSILTAKQASLIHREGPFAVVTVTTAI